MEVRFVRWAGEGGGVKRPCIVDGQMRRRKHRWDQFGYCRLCGARREREK